MVQPRKRETTTNFLSIQYCDGNQQIFKIAQLDLIRGCFLLIDGVTLVIASSLSVQGKWFRIELAKMNGPIRTAFCSADPPNIILGSADSRFDSYLTQMFLLSAWSTCMLISVMLVW